MKELSCKIIDRDGYANFNYTVYDGETKIATGTSSSLDWVKNDAGGYHTKDKFDKLYPEGWKVIFNF